MALMVAPRPRGPTVQRPAAIGASVVLTLMVLVIALERTPSLFAGLVAAVLIGLGLASGWRPVPAGVGIGLVLTAMLAFPEDDTFAVFACLIPIVVLAVLGRRRVQVMLSLWYFTVLATMTILRGSGGPEGSLGTILFVAVLLGGSWLLGAALRALELQREEARRSAIRRVQLSVARDLHDTVAHSLSLIALRADRAQAAQGAHEDLSFIADESRQAIQDLRAMLKMLRRDVDVGGEDLGSADTGSWTIDPLAATLQRDVATLRAAGFQVNDTIEGDLDSLSRTADATLAKVLHETLSNVHRHAEPRTACTIMISVSASAVELAVMSSTRIGEGSGSHAGLGLIGMRERVEASGGELQAGRVNDLWVVQVNLPGAVSRDPVREELR